MDEENNYVFVGRGCGLALIQAGPIPVRVKVVLCPVGWLLVEVDWILAPADYLLVQVDWLPVPVG